MTHLILHDSDPANTPLAQFDLTRAEQLTNELLGVNLRELFPVQNIPTNWEPNPVMLAVNALKARAGALPRGNQMSQNQNQDQTTGFPGLFGAEPQPQDIHEAREEDISDEDRERIQWQQPVDRGGDTFIRYSFESPVAQSTQDTAGQVEEDARLTHIEKELSDLQDFLHTALQNPGSNISVTANQNPIATPTATGTPANGVSALSSPVTSGTSSIAPTNGVTSSPMQLPIGTAPTHQDGSETTSALPTSINSAQVPPTVTPTINPVEPHGSTPVDTEPGGSASPVSEPTTVATPPVEDHTPISGSEGQPSGSGIIPESIPGETAANSETNASGSDAGKALTDQTPHEEV